MWCETYNVCMRFMASKVPFSSEWMLLSYSDNKLRLCKSRNESFRMHEISLAFSSSNCSDVKPRNTLAGNSLILLPYNTLVVDECRKRKRKEREKERENKQCSVVDSVGRFLNEITRHTHRKR